MCGRYELHSNPAAIALAFGLAWPPQITPRYNIAPTQQVPIVRVNARGERELVQVRWGLVPRWAKDASIGVRMINARAETVATKPAFRMAFQRHRCLLPADGFYEWRTRRDGGKQPVYIGMKDRSVFGFAGLYERWLSPEGEPLDTCTILTTDANALLAPLHDRMPVIVPGEAYARWLDPSTDDPATLLVPHDADAMTWWPVALRVNSVRNDDPGCIEPVVTNEADFETRVASSDSRERAADDATTPVQPALPLDEPDAPAPPAQSELF